MSQRVTTAVDNIFRFYEYRPLEQFSNIPFHKMIAFGDDKVAITIDKTNHSLIEIDTTSTFLYKPVVIESAFGLVQKIRYLAPSTIVTLERNETYANNSLTESTNATTSESNADSNEGVKEKVVIYQDIENNVKIDILDFKERIVDVSCHNSRIAVSVESEGIILYDIENGDVVKIAKINTKAGKIKIHRNYIMNYVDHMISVMDINIVDSKEFYENMGDKVTESEGNENKYRWNSVDVEVEMYDNRHITHSMILLQERFPMLTRFQFVPQRTEEEENGVRLALASNSRMEEYFISYTNNNDKISIISNIDFKEDSSQKVSVNSCHLLRVCNDIQMNNIPCVQIYAFRRKNQNAFEIRAAKKEEGRDENDFTDQLTELSKICLIGIDKLIILNHKVIAVRKLSGLVSDKESNEKEVLIFEPSVVSLCQEIINNMNAKRSSSVNKAIFSKLKTNYEVTNVLEAYLYDMYHFMRRKNNNWTDTFWREQMSDQCIVIKYTLKKLYKEIADDLLNTDEGELAAYYYAKSGENFTEVLSKFLISQSKPSVKVYFDLVYFNKTGNAKEEGAELMLSECEKVFKLLEDDCERTVQIAAHPLFQDKQKELQLIPEIQKQHEIINEALYSKCKGTKEHEELLLIETSCIFVLYLLSLPKDVQALSDAKYGEIFKELNRKSRTMENLIMNKFKFVLFKIEKNENEIVVHKEPFLYVLENVRPLLFISLMLNDIELAKNYIESLKYDGDRERSKDSEFIELIAYELLNKQDGSYAQELFEKHFKFERNYGGINVNKDYDRENKINCDNFHNKINTSVPVWIPEREIEQLPMKKMISLLTHYTIDVSSYQDLPEFINKYANRQNKCREFINYLNNSYSNCLIGYVNECVSNEDLLEIIADEALKFEEKQRNAVFDIISINLPIKRFCKIVANAPKDIDLTPFLKKCVGSSFYKKHLHVLCDSFPFD